MRQKTQQNRNGLKSHWKTAFDEKRHGHLVEMYALKKQGKRNNYFYYVECLIKSNLLTLASAKRAKDFSITEADLLIIFYHQEPFILVLESFSHLKAKEHLEYFVLRVGQGYESSNRTF